MNCNRVTDSLTESLYLVMVMVIMVMVVMVMVMVMVMVSAMVMVTSLQPYWLAWWEMLKGEQDQGNSHSGI